MVRDLDVTVTRTSGPVAVLAVTGELNLYTSSGFTTAVQAAADKGHPQLILDLSKVPFCDSSGLSALIALSRSLREANGSLSVAAVPDRVARLLQISGVERIIPAYPTSDEAFEQRSGDGDHAVVAPG